MTFWTNFSLLTWIVLANAVELLMAVVVLGGFFPPVSHLTGQIFPEFSGTLRPEHETLYYRFFIATAFAGQLGAMIFLRRRLEDKEWTGVLKPRALAEGGWLFLLCYAAFKAIVYQPRHQMAACAFGVLLSACFLHKIFFDRCRIFWEQCADFISRPSNAGGLRFLLAIGGFILIAAVIGVPNSSAAVARFFVGEQFHHNDSFIMGPVWVVASGLTPNWDVISQYGFGFPYVMHALAHLLGGISYESVFLVMVLMTIVYYMGWFWLLRRWFDSVALGLAAVILGIKWQMFHPGVYPFVFTYAGTTPVRFVFDLLFFACLYRHLSGQKQPWFWLAGIAAGAQIWYLTSEGVYLTLAWWFYAGWLFVEAKGLRQSKTWRSLVFSLTLPLVSALVLFALTAGPAVFQSAFWANMREFAQYFFSGFGVMPMTTDLTDREFGASLMGFLLPIVYVMTIIMASILIYSRAMGRSALMAVILAVYGLGLYHYYVTRSTLTSYLVGGLPLAWIIGFWLKYISTRWALQARRWFYISLLGASCFALATTHLFVAYPDILNWSRNPYTDPLVAMPLKDGRPYFYHLFRDIPAPFKFNVNVFGKADDGLRSEADFSSDDALIEYYRQASDFSRDAALIQRYTSAGQRVPLISSFEIKMLMDAGRKPYFYYFPLIISRPMTMRALAKTSIYTTGQLRKTINALERDRPSYIFMEKMFTVRPLPDYFYQEYTSFLLLTDYVLKNYEPVDGGQYLVAMKRKE